jgi:hypothetical protein
MAMCVVKKRIFNLFFPSSYKLSKEKQVNLLKIYFQKM